MKSRDISILKKMVSYCEQIGKTHIYFDKDKALFFDKEEGHIYRNSINMEILQIGELVGNLSEEFREEHKEIPWKAIRGIRNIYAHQYGAIDYEISWETSTGDMVEFEQEIQNILMEANGKVRAGD